MSANTNNESYLNKAPEEWERIKIGEIFKFSSGKSRPKDIRKFPTDNYRYPVYGGNGKLGYSMEYVTETPHLILGRVGEYCGCAHITEEKAWISDNALYTKEIFEEVDFDYFKFFFDFFDLNRFSNKNGQPLITQGNIAGLLIAKPTLTEQKQIGYILNTIKNNIQKQNDIITITQLLKKSLLNKLFTEGTKRESLKQTDIGMIPKSWEMKKLGELCDISSGGTPSRDIKDYWNDGSIHWVKTGEINYSIITNTSEKITSLGLKNSSTKMFPAGTLLMAMYGQGVTRGRVAILGIDATINQACAAITPYSEERISSKYLYRYLEFQYENIRELGHGANQKNLSGTIIKTIPIVYPSQLEEQELIYSSIDAIENKLDHHKNKKAAYEALFKTLLNDLMTGTVRVKDIDFQSTNLTVKVV